MQKMKKNPIICVNNISISTMFDFYEKYGKLEKKLGEGSHGTVYRSSKGYALKVYDTKFIDCYIIREMSILSSMDHPNIIHMLDYADIKGYFQFAMPLGEYDLDTKMDEGPMEIRELKSITFQLFGALDYLHKRDIWHRDVKLDNILMMSDGTIKLCDFGLAKEGISQDMPYTDEVTTISYRPPEIELLINDIPTSYNEKIDIWSAGQCILNLFKGKYTSINKKDKIRLKNDLEAQDPLFSDFIFKVMAYDKDKRYSAREALEHPWLKKFTFSPIVDSKTHHFPLKDWVSFQKIRTFP